MRTVDIMGLMFFFALVTPTFGLLCSLLLEEVTDEFSKTSLDVRWALERFGAYDIKINLLKILYGWVIFSLFNVMVLILPFFILDAFAWVFQIKIRSSKWIGKFIYDKLQGE